MLLLLAMLLCFNLLLINGSNFDVLKVSPSLSPEWEVYTNNKYGIKIKYPKMWSYRLKDNPWSSFIELFPPNEKQSGAKVAIRIETLYGLITLKEYTDSFKQEVIKYNEESRFISQKDSLLLRTKAYQVIYDFKRDNKRVKKMAIIALRHKKAYIIFYESEHESFSKLESLVQVMVDSLEVINP